MWLGVRLFLAGAILSCVQAHALSCFELETPVWRPPKAAVRNQNILAAAEAIHKFLDEQVMITDTWSSEAVQILGTPQPAIRPYFRDFVEQTRHDLLARGFPKKEVDDFFRTWNFETAPSLSDVWNFAHASIHFYGNQTREPWVVTRLRDEVDLVMAKIFLLPLPYALNFEVRSKLFLMGVAPVTLQFRKEVVDSFLDQTMRSAKRDLLHDLGHAREFVYFRTDSDPQTVQRFFRITESLSAHQKKIAFFIRDRVFSEGARVFNRQINRSAFKSAIPDRESYLRSRYWVRFSKELLPVSDTGGDWIERRYSVYRIVWDSAVSPRPHAGVVVGINEVAFGSPEAVVIDRREGLLKDLGLPTEMSWEELQSLIDATVFELSRKIDEEFPE